MPKLNEEHPRNKIQKIDLFEQVRQDKQGRARSYQWYMDTIDKYKRYANRQQIIKQNQDDIVNNLEIGDMYMMYYDPKHKDKLPYYDKFPLIIPFNMDTNGHFWGLNLHYLTPELRWTLLKELLTLKNQRDLTPRTKLKITYATIVEASSSKLYLPCVKQYLFTHVLSMQNGGRFLKIDPRDWRSAILLPTQSFVKRRAKTVWDKSKLHVDEHIRKLGEKNGIT